MTPQNYANTLTPTDLDTTASTPGEWFWVNCTVAGNVSVDLESNNTLVFYVEIGQSILALAVSRVNTTGTTATATYFNTRHG